MQPEQESPALHDVRTKVEKAYAAWLKYRHFTQERIDAVVEAMAAAGREHARRLAEMAVEETGYGNVKDKIAKNLLNADLLPRKMRGMRTVGVLRELPSEKVIEVGMPMGVVAAILPTTNPTSTAIYKILISLKAGNTVVLSPHPRARRCTCETADLLYQAALKAGAPEDVIQCLTESSVEVTHALMKHRRTAVILSTGGAGIVRAAYSSGKPAFGVGPGNVPVLIDTSADVPDAVKRVVEGKAFDYGTVCSSEQAIVAERSLRAAILDELRAQKAFLCNESQRAALAKLLVTPDFKINPDCVGQPPQKLARMAGFEVPPGTSILAVEIEGVGKEHPLSMEKLSPVLALLWTDTFQAAMDACDAILHFGGLGHTCVIFARDEARIREFGLRMPAHRVLVNTAAPHGSTGITTNVFPSMTLGCGAMAGNITGDNVGPQHLMGIKRIAYAVREAHEAIQIPEYVEEAVPAVAASADRRVLIEAVERYLAQRGIRLEPQQAPGPPAAAPRAAILPSPADIVDRFLAGRSARQAPAADASTCSVCAVPQPQASPPPSPPPEEKRPQAVEFVCEEDVRAAIRQNRKIHIGPKTIVTPAARDLAAQHDVLVGM